MIRLSRPVPLLSRSLVLMILSSTAALAAFPAPVIAPTRIYDDDRTPISKVTPNDGFAYFSGFTEPVMNHPTLYAHGGTGGEKMIVVLGQGTYEEFPITKFNQAIQRYRELLAKRGYGEVPPK